MEEKKKTAVKSEKLMHDLTPKKTENPMKPAIIFVIAILLGIGVGYIATRGGINKSAISGNVTLNKSAIEKGKTYGSSDTKAFPDSAEGKVEKGGIEGEGAYHLVRPGGDSQNVYMTSSLVDLNSFVGHTVKVWGQTQSAKTAGWLMDVGRVEVVE